jgi:flagellar basal body-associated protein FliL
LDSERNNSYIFNNRGDDRMSDKKQLVILYGVVLAVVIGGTMWMSHEINSRVVLEQPTSSVDIQAFCTEALQPKPEFCGSNDKTATNGTYDGLRVVNNYDEQRTANVNMLEPKVSDVYLQYGANASGQVKAQGYDGCLVLNNEGACNEY